MPLPLLFAATTLANMAHGFYEKSQAEKGLRSLVKPQGFNVTPEQQSSYSSAQKSAQSGYSGAEKAAFQNNLSRQNNTQYNKAMTYGGNTLAGAITAGINYGNNRALTDFAANDAAQHRANIRYADSRGDAISAQRNRQTQLENQNYNEAQRAYGGAVKSAKENIWGSLNLFAATNPYLKGMGVGQGVAGQVGAAQRMGDNGGGNGDADYNQYDESQVPFAGAESQSAATTNWGASGGYGSPQANYGMKRFPPYSR